MIENGPKVEELRVIKNMEYAPLHTSSPFLSMTLFCKQKEFNFEIILYLYLNTILDIML